MTLTPSPQLLVFLAVLCAAPAATAQGRFAKVKIKTVEVSKNIAMLQGAGGNMGLCWGDDGAFLIDDQFAPLTKKIQAAVKTKTQQPIKFVLNTHWHGDHTGGNENLGKAGAVIVAHANVRKRMKLGQFMKAFRRQVPPAPKQALPVITFTKGVTFHLNGETIRAIHVPPAHTDGDSLVHFKQANVLHMGDLFFNGLYPFIDESSGGSMKGVIAAADRALKLVDSKTKIIPGHGKLSNKKELQAYRTMLATVHAKLSGLIAKGKSLEEILAAKPTAAYDAKWGQGFLKPKVWVRLMVSLIKKERKASKGKKSGK